MKKGRNYEPKALYHLSELLWHLDVFRRNFRDQSEHNCTAESCIFCALKELFSKLQFCNEKAIPPDILKRLLPINFLKPQKFHLGMVDDAVECYENLLIKLHSHVVHGSTDEVCTAPNCITHMKFSMMITEHHTCDSCGTVSDPLLYSQIIHYVSSSTLAYQNQVVIKNQQKFNVSFGKLLKKAGSISDIRICPNACGSVIKTQQTLTNHPEVVSIGIIWNSKQPTLEHIVEILTTIGTTLNTGDLFNVLIDNVSISCVYNLTGFVTYNGKNYTTFFFNSKLKIWISYDDAVVCQVGSQWEKVIEKCRKGKCQPLLLIYSMSSDSLINIHKKKLYSQKRQLSPKQAMLNRSLTPNPEKPIIINGNTRRAITPNPDFNLKYPNNGEYENLAVIQKNITPIMHHHQHEIHQQQQQHGVRRTLSNGSSSGMENLIPDHLNIPRRRDSGNWSGDRNSASSSSSTTLENPYQYLLTKVPYSNNNLPGSPTKNNVDYFGNRNRNDPGYDSYSLSSNDSTNFASALHLIKTGNLAQIPEDYNNSTASHASPSCDVLCDEADELLVKSRKLEDEHDLVLALALCNAATMKARAAMSAPYNNQQMLTLARMKHNTCVMRARSLQRRMTQTFSVFNEPAPEIRHTREGSTGSNNGRHSRQNSKEKLIVKQKKKDNNNLPQQLPPSEVLKPTNIEIYATLPKKKKVSKCKVAFLDDIDRSDDYITYEETFERPSRSLFGRSKNKNNIKTERRSISEDRNKISVDTVDSVLPKNKQDKSTNKLEKESGSQGKSKKQHKIRRKLLLGNLIKRKNRSMPDLTEANLPTEPNDLREKYSIDDSALQMKDDWNTRNMSGYLSEGHLEFTVVNKASSNFERSKLMRKGGANDGQMLTIAKVPPPPPLRTSSQLTKLQLNKLKKHNNNDDSFNHYDSTTTYNTNANTIVTKADIHDEKPKIHYHHKAFEKNEITPPESNGVDEVDFPIRKSVPNLDLPPYPSPHGSVIHSRQNSEELPPPPSDLDILLFEKNQELISENHNKQHYYQINNNYNNQKNRNSIELLKPETSLFKELQAKQHEIKTKNKEIKYDEICEATQHEKMGSVKSVKDLTSRFENINIIQPVECIKSYDTVDSGPSLYSTNNKVIMVQNQSLNGPPRLDVITNNNKKKSVSFCDQITLVATADEQIEDDYIPNPILERVLRSAMNKSDHLDLDQQQPPPSSPSAFSISNSENEFSTKAVSSSQDTVDYDYYTKRQIPQVQQIPNKPINYSQDRYFNVNNSIMQQQSHINNGIYGEHFRNVTPNHMQQQQQHHNNIEPPRQYSSSPHNIHNPHNNLVQNNGIYYHHHHPQNGYSTQYIPPMQRSAQPVNNDYSNRDFYEYECKQAEIYSRVPPPHMSQQQQIYNNNEKINGNTAQYNNMYSSPLHENPQVGKPSYSNETIRQPQFNNQPSYSSSSKIMCNLCRNKLVMAPNLYCKDCDFYMSRFKPKT